MNTYDTTAAELATMLNRVAYDIAEGGTATELWILDALAAAARDVCPGAAVALADWEGAEVARLRAFGIVHGAVLGALTTSDQQQLLQRLRGSCEPVHAG